ncbi:hypothetical protein PHSY_000300 [Pseudozyma hubeiensis SY62]|uniref:Uncharacterized protein n=1 Tax=Pseudozyma hubeiensis (strain SY62) TaxID=1305764 RepID=R9P3S6_PSEHS|nr:hypothetical protein PHSY_000300 [Pseudozyma hubeiensis SY62]GAC92745.1 hypothetical protein PHSY_000300 [Pseudozyma hubeiensis SY62]
MQLMSRLAILTFMYAVSKVNREAAEVQIDGERISLLDLITSSNRNWSTLSTSISELLSPRRPTSFREEEGATEPQQRQAYGRSECRAPQRAATTNLAVRPTKLARSVSGSLTIEMV